MTRNEIIATVFAAFALAYLFLEAYMMIVENIIKRILG
jgi:hypothetical protein